MRCTPRIRSIGWAPTIAAFALLMLAAAPSPAADLPDAPGTFLGADLITEDAQAAASFYARLFSWDVEKVENGGYAIHHHGRLIASISQIDGSMPEADESFWLVGIVVNNLDLSVSAVRENEGAILEDVTKVAKGYGRFAVVGDGEKAPIMLIEPGKTRIGGTKGPGAWVWAELWTQNLEKATTFYADVVGVGHHEYELGDQAYHLFTSQGKGRAGIIMIPPELEKVEPGWAPYVAVENLELSLAKTKELGGKVVFSETEHPAQGSVALILDPTGAALFLYEIGSHEEAKK